MAKKRRIGLDILYSLNQGKTQVQSLVSAAAVDYSITAGVSKVSVQSSIGNASINGDTLFLDFPESDSAITLNGSEINSVSLTGGDIDINTETKIANIKLTGGVESVSVVSSIGNASINGDTLFLDFPESDNAVTLNGAKISSISIVGGTVEVDTQTKAANVTISGGGSSKPDANFIITPNAVTLPSYESANVTISTASNGLINCYSLSDKLTCAMSGNTATLTAGLVTDTVNTACNFYQLETQHYAAGFVDVPVVILPSDSEILLCHFNGNDINEVTGLSIGLPITQTSVPSPHYFSDGKFGQAVWFVDQTVVDTGIAFPSTDWTLDFWLANVATSGTFFEIFSGTNRDLPLFKRYGVGNAKINFCEVDYAAGDPTADFWHYAVTKQGNVFKLYVNGILFKTVTYTKALDNLKFYSYQQTWDTANFWRLDELHLAKGLRWTENFTPPNEPY